MKPYYSDDAVTIYHADCMDVLPTLSDVDLFITSPPYNLGVSAGGGFGAGSMAAKSLVDGYDAFSDDLNPEAYDTWQRAVVRVMWDALSDQGAIFYNHKPRPWDGEIKLPTAYGAGLPLRQVIVWDRGIGMNYSRSHFLPKCEWICVWARSAFRLKDKQASQVGDVWRFPPEQGVLDHPAPFPLGLPARVLEATAPALVVDPFMGSGTTLRAAKNVGVCAIGIEQSERYCEIAAKRLAQGVLDLGGVA